jgi:peroxiredoxin
MEGTRMTNSGDTAQSVKREGDAVPDVTFRVRAAGEWVDVSSSDIFKGKRVVVFALPGAFTPTCSITHLPGYRSLVDDIKKHGIHDVYCLSVNDSFVMNAWAKDQAIDGKIGMIPDGSGHFSGGMGMLVDKDDLGFGMRSWRYAMVVNDGIIEKMFIEDFNEPGDPFNVSDAFTVLDYLKMRC